MFQRGTASRGAEVTTTTRDDGIPTEFKALESWVSLKDLGGAFLFHHRRFSWPRLRHGSTLDFEPIGMLVYGRRGNKNVFGTVNSNILPSRLYLTLIVSVWKTAGMQLDEQFLDQTH